MCIRIKYIRLTVKMKWQFEKKKKTKQNENDKKIPHSKKSAKLKPRKHKKNVEFFSCAFEFVCRE